jgi:hypothetical protein
LRLLQQHDLSLVRNLFAQTRPAGPKSSKRHLININKTTLKKCR